MTHAEIEGQPCTLYLDYDCQTGTLKRLSVTQGYLAGEKDSDDIHGAIGENLR